MRVRVSPPALSSLLFLLGGCLRLNDQEPTVPLVPAADAAPAVADVAPPMPARDAAAVPVTDAFPARDSAAGAEAAPMDRPDGGPTTDAAAGCSKDDECGAGRICVAQACAVPRCGDGRRTGSEYCDDGPMALRELGHYNPECTGFYEKKFIKRTAKTYAGNMGGWEGAVAICRDEFGGAWSALIVGGGLIASRTPNAGDGQEWGVRKYRHYVNEAGVLVWRTDDVPLLGVRDGIRMALLTPLYRDGVVAWGGYANDWTTLPETSAFGTCRGWTSSAASDRGSVVSGDLILQPGAPCAQALPLLCVES